MKTLDIGETVLAYEDGGAGRVLLLVHGFPLDHTMWRRQIDHFSAFCRVIAPDLRGFGASPPPPGLDTQPAAMRTYADDLNLLLDRLEIREPIVYCGLSMGGYIGWQFWQKYAQRVAGLVACDTRAIADVPQAAAGRETLARHVLEAGTDPVAEAMLPKLFDPEMTARHPQVVAETRAAIGRASRAGVAAALRGMAIRPDVTDMLGGINVPTLIVVGEHDVISPVAEMRGIAEKIPGAEFVRIPTAGHMSPLENPAAFNAALGKFLRERII
jgi:3-oxoadipate enol-lactonase